MARYLEARRAGESALEATATAHHETWLPTLTAASAAGAAYGSLIVTEQRGLRDFGVIGSAGMLLCWLATFWTLPSVLATIDRFAPLERAEQGPIAKLRALSQGGLAFGRPFAALAGRSARLVTLLGLTLFAIGAVLTVRYVMGDPMEYDARKLRNDPSARRSEMDLAKLAEGVTGYVGADGMAILVDREDQVAPLRSALLARRDTAPGEKPFESVHALQDFVPSDQAAKIPLLFEIKDKVARAKKRGLVTDADWEKIERHLPPDDLRPFGLGDFPEDTARPFSETDGTRGRIVYIRPITRQGAIDDAHYLLRWADAYRETKLPDGSVVLGSGRAVIYAEMWAAILKDAPRAVVVSLGATILVVFIAFRRGRSVIAVLGALLVGVVWMVGALALFGVRLNFLNFIALPITFGIGVDYSVNVVQRYVREGSGGALTAVRETGGAVILCSLTTTLGYLALVRSTNQGVQSLGVAAVLGEVACLFSAVLILPAALVWLDRSRAARTARE
jgi:hypothetical protein